MAKKEKSKSKSKNKTYVYANNQIKYARWASLRMTPEEPVFLIRSEPARSTRFNLEVITWAHIKTLRCTKPKNTWWSIPQTKNIRQPKTHIETVIQQRKDRFLEQTKNLFAAVDSRAHFEMNSEHCVRSRRVDIHLMAANLSIRVAVKQQVQRLFLAAGNDFGQTFHRHLAWSGEEWWNQRAKKWFRFMLRKKLMNNGSTSMQTRRDKILDLPLTSSMTCKSSDAAASRSANKSYSVSL